MALDTAELNKAFDELDNSLIKTLSTNAVVSHIAGDLATQNDMGFKVSFNLVKSAATEYGKEYKKLLVDRGGGYVVNEAGQFEFKPWFSQSSKASREKVADIINAGIKEGKGIRETKKELAEFFTQRKNHAELVARTETAKVQSIATTTRLKQQGIEYVQWVTAEDERVRSSHAERHMKVYRIGEAPSLGEPNCRCNIFGYVADVSDIDVD